MISLSISLSSACAVRGYMDIKRVLVIMIRFERQNRELLLLSHSTRTKESLVISRVVIPLWLYLTECSFGRGFLCTMLISKRTAATKGSKEKRKATILEFDGVFGKKPFHVELLHCYCVCHDFSYHVTSICK